MCVCVCVCACVRVRPLFRPCQGVGTPSWLRGWCGKTSGLGHKVGDFFQNSVLILDFKPYAHKAGGTEIETSQGREELLGKHTCKRNILAKRGSSTCLEIGPQVTLNQKPQESSSARLALQSEDEAAGERLLLWVWFLVVVRLVRSMLCQPGECQVKHWLRTYGLLRSGLFCGISVVFQSRPAWLQLLNQQQDIT